MGDGADLPIVPHQNLLVKVVLAERGRESLMKGEGGDSPSD